MTVDFGLVPNMSIGSTVFFDMNNDGTQSGVNEIGIANITVQLLYDANNDGFITGSELVPVLTTTNGSGNYFFGSLPSGNYQVVIPTTPQGAPLSSTITATTDNNVDSNDDGAQPGGIGTATSSPVFNLSNNGEVLDAAEAGQGGQQDNTAANPDQNGNMTDRLRFCAGAVDRFDGVLRCGQQRHAGCGQPIGRRHRRCNGEPVLRREQRRRPERSGRERPLVGDDNGRGRQLLLRHVVPGQLHRGHPDRASGRTGIEHEHSDLHDGQHNGRRRQRHAGRWRVCGRGGIQSTLIVLTPNGETADEPGQGGTQDDAFDTNGNMTVDFGFVPNMSIGSTVFNDPNDNGVQDISNPLENGIAGVAVQLLYDINGDGTIDNSEVVATDVTNGNGNYFFGNLPPGTYRVLIPVPDASAQISSSVTTNNANTDVDGDDNGIQTGAGNPVRSNNIVLVPGTEPDNTVETFQGNNQDNGAESNGNMTVDFGFVPTMSIGSTVWSDVTTTASRTHQPAGRRHRERNGPVVLRQRQQPGDSTGPGGYNHDGRGR